MFLTIFTQPTYLRSAILPPNYQKRVDAFRAAQTLKKKNLIPEAPDISTYSEDEQRHILEDGFSAESLEIICETIIPLSEAIFDDVVPRTLTTSDFSTNDFYYDMLPHYLNNPSFPLPYIANYQKMENEGQHFWVTEFNYVQALWLSERINQFSILPRDNVR